VVSGIFDEHCRRYETTLQETSGTSCSELAKASAVGKLGISILCVTVPEI